MRKGLTIILVVFFVLASLSNGNNLKKENLRLGYKEIKVEINENIETLSLIYSLADDELINVDFAEKAHLLKHYLKEFEKFKDHPAVKKMKFLLKKEIFGASCVTYGLFYTDFPEFKEKYPFDFSVYKKEEKNQLLEFYQLARKFYKDVKLSKFFIKHHTVYERIKNEVKSVLPSNSYIKTLEKFHGISMLDYVIIPSIFVPNYFNYGPTIKTRKGIINYYVMGPAYDVNIKSGVKLPDKLGFNAKSYIFSIGIHEFGHTFVRFIDKPKNARLINSISYLNTEELRKKIYPQGYGNWKGVFEEHLVRVCEIEIAKMMNNEKYSKILYEDNVIKRGFKYIPYILDIIPQYEKNRDKYKTFEEFFPLIIKKLSEVKIKR